MIVDSLWFSVMGDRLVMAYAQLTYRPLTFLPTPTRHSPPNALLLTYLVFTTVQATRTFTQQNSSTMETSNPYNRGPQPIKKETESTSGFNGRAFAGLVVVIVGSALFVKQLGVPMPRWIISWPMFLIALGLFIGFKHKFQNISWLILISIGGIFLASEIMHDYSLQRYFWPIFIIGIGLYMILKPKKKDENIWMGEVTSSENFLEATAVFGGVKKNVITKDFKGGEVTSIFGGSEIILSQADINGKVVLDVTAIFGGSKVIVPSNWQVSTEEVTAILGGVDDKRAIMANANPDPNKVLVIKGVAIFGGIEIKSF